MSYLIQKEQICDNVFKSSVKFGSYICKLYKSAFLFIFLCTRVINLYSVKSTSYNIIVTEFSGVYNVFNINANGIALFRTDI